ncbi:N-acetylmuramoyl-L-alanine amidase family protein [Marinoscillum furvescens]|nr:N-acetylmuramoyl-L-alanine amidase [Marinoscillum furvescens]
MRNIAVAFAICILMILGSFHSIGVKNYKIDKIVIDPGHGGRDPGTHGAISEEKNVALKIALELGRIIKENLPEVEVVYTRNDDSFPQLHERADLANQQDADLFVSIHANWVANPRIHGMETYVMGIDKLEKNFQIAKRENSVILLEENSQDEYDGFDPNSPESYILFSLYQSAYQQNSLRLAQNIESQMKTRVGRNSRGVRSAPFLVLWRTSMPSVLFEVGYLSNAKEERDLNDKLNQVYIASGIYRAFRDYKQELESMN